MTDLVLGVLVDRPTPQAFADLLAVLRRWCRPVAWADDMPAPAAWITTSPAIAPPTDAPRAVWVESEDDRNHPDAATAAVLVCADLRLADRGSRTIAVTGTLDADVPTVTPFVRSRYRRARGLPDELVIRVAADGAVSRLPGGAAIDGELRGTALALASAAAVYGPALATALAWGTPCVTDASSAAAVGATHDVHVIVASNDDPYGAALALARDERKAAALSTAGRRLVETTLDRVAPARRVADRLGLLGASPGARVDAMLEYLDTPAAAPIRSRARAAMPA